MRAAERAAMTLMAQVKPVLPRCRRLLTEQHTPGMVGSADDLPFTTHSQCLLRAGHETPHQYGEAEEGR